MKATNLANEIQQWSCMSGHTKVRPGNVMILPDFFGLTSDSLKNILLSDQDSVRGEQLKIGYMFNIG